MIHPRSYPVCITYTTTLTMANPSRQSRQVIPPIRRWCTIVSIRLPKFINWLWITHLFIRNPWLVSSMQLLIHPSHVQCKRYGLNDQININAWKDGKGIVKFEFITSCLAFRSSISTYRKLSSHNYYEGKVYFFFL